MLVASPGQQKRRQRKSGLNIHEPSLYFTVPILSAETIIPLKSHDNCINNAIQMILILQANYTCLLRSAAAPDQRKQAGGSDSRKAQSVCKEGCKYVQKISASHHWQGELSAKLSARFVTEIPCAPRQLHDLCMPSSRPAYGQGLLSLYIGIMEASFLDEKAMHESAFLTPG